ncbi:MAG: RluA family pseudouridine synthase [Clostridiales bacterium]|nr:RluA family pseudouridine synthase [Clostridiales bacterium]
MTQPRIVPVEESGQGERIDKYLSQKLPDMSRSLIQQCMESGRVTINGAAVQKNRRLAAGEEIRLRVPEVQPLSLEPEEIALDIRYEDAHLLVVNKPKGMVVHPAAGHASGTLVNALLAHCGDSLSGINGVMRPGIVHRLDKDTRGRLIVAKNDAAHQGLAAQIQAHSFSREYEAVVHGCLGTDSGTLDYPIGRHPVHRKKMAVTQLNSKPAVTHYRVIERYRKYTHVRLILETGRTHQIRVHMAHIGHPVAGDAVYGRAGHPELAGQCLHARYIAFRHPVTGEGIALETELPEYFHAFLKKL